jgi:hypothetical protein
MKFWYFILSAHSLAKKWPLGTLPEAEWQKKIVRELPGIRVAMRSGHLMTLPETKSCQYSSKKRNLDAQKPISCGTFLNSCQIVSKTLTLKTQFHVEHS